MATLTDTQTKISKSILNMLFYTSQIHLTHWLTIKNHHHVITGDLYKELQDELDSLAEQYLGASLPTMKPEDALNLMDQINLPKKYKVVKTEEDILQLLSEITAYAKNLLSIVEKDKEFSFMQDSVMDIIAVLHSAKYQISQQ